MTPLVVENEPLVTFLRRKMTGGRFSMGVVIRRYTGTQNFETHYTYSKFQNVDDRVETIHSAFSHNNKTAEHLGKRDIGEELGHVGFITYAQYAL